MCLFENIKVYQEYKIPKKKLLDDVMKLLDNLEILKEEFEEYWILKINGDVIIPDYGNLLIFWPSGDEGKDIITQYCNMIEKENYWITNFKLKVQIAFLLDDITGDLSLIKTYFPSKEYQNLFNLIKEFEQQQLHLHLQEQLKLNSRIKS